MTGSSEGIGNNIGVVLRQEFDDAAKDRQVFEEKWSSNLAMYRGKSGDKNDEEIIFRLAKTKIEAITARLIDLLFPASGELSWGIESTPVPTLGMEVKNRVFNELVQSMGGQQPTMDQLEAAIRAEAKRCAEAMQDEIKDQLSEESGKVGFRELSRRVIRSGLLYGTGILKGPMITKKSRKRWAVIRDEFGAETWDLEEYQDNEIMPYNEAVSVWDCYPDPSATDISNARFLWQTHLMSRSELHELAKRKAFKGDVIYQYIKDNPDGDAEKEKLDSEDKIRSVAGTQSKATQNKYRYRVYERWGLLSGKELQDCGVTIADDPDGIKDYASNIWIIGDKVVKAVIAPVQGISIPYYFYYYNKDETSIWGAGIPDDIGAIQNEINETIKAMRKNTALSASPQISVNMQALDPGQATKVDSITASGIWKFDNAEDMNSAFRLWEIPNKSAQYIQLVQFYQNFIDELTAPRFISGDGRVSGAGDTASGLSMLMGALNVNLKELIKSFDDCVTEPFITALYHWNMQLNPKEEIKGDFEIQARGSSALVAKEVLSDKLVKAVEVSSNPKFDGLVKDDDLLRELFKVMDVSRDLVRTPEEIQQYRFDMALQQARANLSAQIEELEKRGLDPGQALAGLFRQTAAESQQMIMPPQQPMQQQMVAA